MVRDVLFYALPAGERQGIPEPTQVGLYFTRTRILHRASGRTTGRRPRGRHIEVITAAAAPLSWHRRAKTAPQPVTVGQKPQYWSVCGRFPTCAEVENAPAATYFVRDLTTAQVRRIIEWLRRLG
jgi:hypothetical protein